MSQESSSKAAIRANILTQRRQLSLASQVQAGEAIARIVLQQSLFDSFQHVGLYWAHQKEISTQNLFHQFFKQGKQLYLPRVSGKTLEFAAVPNLETLVSGAYGILEPKAELPAVPLERIQALLIPGLAFDLQGNRIGWGKGYYDEVLKHFSGFRVGLAYDFQILKKLPHSAKDEPVHGLLTNLEYQLCQKTP